MRKNIEKKRGGNKLLTLKDLVLKALENPKCQPIKGEKSNDDEFISFCWALEITEDTTSEEFKRVQQKIFRFLQKHSESESLFRIRRQFGNGNKAESAQALGLLYSKANADEDILPHEEARQEIKKAREALK